MPGNIYIFIVSTSDSLSGKFGIGDLAKASDTHPDIKVIRTSDLMLLLIARGSQNFTRFWVSVRMKYYVVQHKTVIHTQDLKSIYIEICTKKKVRFCKVEIK